MAFPNFYYKRTAATAKACYICYKPTVTVLATIDTADFFYTCPVHLTDRGFATRAPEPEPEPEVKKPSPEEIAMVKQEWEEKQRQKKDKVQAQHDDDGKNGSDVVKGEEGKDVDAGTDGGQEKKSPPAPSPPSEAPAPKPTHERYILHRNIFSLRTADHRRRRQAAQTKELAPRFPAPPSALR